MGQGTGATTAYYVWIVYEPYTTLYKTETQKTTRCRYKELNAYCSIGKLSNSHANVLRRELSEQWRRITQPQSKRYTCHNTILLLQEPDAVLRWLGESSPFKHIPDEAIWQFKLSISKQELGFEQCRALDNCISLVNAAKVLDGYKDGKVLTISEQSVQVDLRCWESVTTLKRLSRSVGIEPTNNGGWIDKFIKKMGFTSHIQNYEVVKTAILDAKFLREKGNNKVGRHSSLAEKKYDAVVKALIDRSIDDVTQGKGKFIQKKDIVTLLKKTEEFKDISKSAIDKGIGRTMAWKKRKETLAKALKIVGMGATYDKKKKAAYKNGKRIDAYEKVQ